MKILRFKPYSGWSRRLGERVVIEGILQDLTGKGTSECEIHLSREDVNTLSESLLQAGKDLENE